MTRNDDYQAHGLIPGITKALVFTFNNGDGATLADLAGGQVQFDIPSDWTVDPGYIEVVETEGGTNDFLYITDADGDVIDNEDDTDPTAVKNRVAIATSRGKVREVTVNLGDHWEDGASLVITLGSAKAPSDRGAYDFTTKSKGKGVLKDLATQPGLMIGNVDPGYGKLELNHKKVYVGQDKIDFEITFTAAGPMYDYEYGADDTEFDSRIRITTPTYLSNPTASRLTGGDPSEGYVYLDDTSGSVRLASDPLDVDSGTITIDVVEMDDGESITVAFNNVTVLRAGTNGFMAETTTRPVTGGLTLDEGFEDFSACG